MVQNAVNDRDLTISIVEVFILSAKTGEGPREFLVVLEKRRTGSHAGAAV
jgi:hypothetical protein